MRTRGDEASHRLTVPGPHCVVAPELLFTCQKIYKFDQTEIGYTFSEWRSFETTKKILKAYVEGKMKRGRQNTLAGLCAREF